MKSIAVFCASSLGIAPIFEETARQLGKMLAKKQITLIYGGGKLGLMGALADSVMAHGGQVIGVIPGFLCTKEVGHTGITELITVETMHERKLKMSDLCEGVIVLPGGFGTLDELAEMLTWAQLGLHQKPIGILNVEGYYDPLDQLFRTMETNGLLKTYNRSIPLFATHLEELFTLMENYRPVPVKKWLKDKEKT